MSNIFLCSDHHFSHANILTFKDGAGNPVRSFPSVEEMDETMIQNHNRVVSKSDKVYFLGDVAFNKKALANVARLNGEKVLIKGNHDKESIQEYLKYFKDVRGSHQFDGMLLTHIPVHVESLGRWPINVHGHTHTNRVKKLTYKVVDDHRYFCVCMEQINYTPISLETLKKESKYRLETSL